MHSYNHGALWLACVLLSGDLRAQDTPSDQSVSPPISTQDQSLESPSSLSSTNQGNNASRNGLGLFRDATTIERATLISVIDLQEGHRHQAIFKVNALEATTLRFELPPLAHDIGLSVNGLTEEARGDSSELRVELPPLSLAKIQIDYTSESMQAPKVLDGITTLASTREIFGSRHVEVSTERPSILSAIVRPTTRSAEVVLRMAENLDWEIIKTGESLTEEMRGVIMPREVATEIVDDHALALQWRVSPEQAVNTLRKKLLVTGLTDGSAVRFQMEDGHTLVHSIAKAYQDHRIALAEEVRNNAVRIAQFQRELDAQAAKTEAARQRLDEIAEAYEMTEPERATLELESRRDLANEEVSSEDQSSEPAVMVPPEKAPVVTLPKATFVIPHGFLPKLTQAQAGPWTTFNYEILDLKAQTRRAWLVVAVAVFLMALTVTLYKRGVLTSLYLSSRERLRFG